MALGRVKTWGIEALLAVDLNTEFNNILDNALSLISPLTGTLDFGSNPGTNVDYFTFDEQSSGAATNANEIGFYAKEAGGQSEAFIREESSGDEVQVTSYGSVVYDNSIINGDFRVAQRGTSFTAATTPANNDDTYLLDRWILLSDGNDTVDVSQSTAVVPAGFYSSMLLDTETANRKFGILQILSARDSAKCIGRRVCLSFYARTTTGAVIENIRAAVLAWNSTADSVTSDVVSAWGAEGANPTLVANWTFENTAANIAVTADSFAYHEITDINIDTASATNIAVFIWVDDTDAAVADFLYISGVRMGLGAGQAKPGHYSDELSRAMYYFEYQDYSVAAEQYVCCAQATTTAAAH